MEEKHANTSKAVEEAKIAVKLDAEHDLRGALVHYGEALTALMAVLQAEKDEERKKKIHEKMNEYFARAEAIKAELASVDQLPPVPASVAAMKSSPVPVSAPVSAPAAPPGQTTASSVGQQAGMLVNQGVAKAKEVNADYHITERISALFWAGVEKAKEIDQTYAVHETVWSGVQTSAKAVGQFVGSAATTIARDTK